MPLGKENTLRLAFFEKQIRCQQLNSESEEYGYPRVSEQFSEVATETPEVIIRQILQDNTCWAEGIPQGDDTTLVALKVKV